MKIMNKVLLAACLGASSLICGAQNVTYNTLIREQALFRNYISSGNNEFENAKKNQEAGQCTLAERVLVKAYVYLDRAEDSWSLPENHEERIIRVVDYPLLQSRNGALKSLQEGLNKLRTSQRDSYRVLEDYRDTRFKRACPDSGKMLEAYLRVRQQYKGTDSWSNMLAQVMRQIDSGNPNLVITNKQGEKFDLGSNAQQVTQTDSTLEQLRNEGLSPADAAAAVAALNNGDIATLLALAKKYPGSKTIADMLAKACLKAGISQQDTAALINAIRTGDLQTVANILNNYKNNPAVAGVADALKNLGVPIPPPGGASINNITTDPNTAAAYVAQLKSEGLSDADAQAAIDAFKNRDLKKLAELLKKYPNSKTLAALMETLCVQLGMKPEDAKKLVDAIKTGDTATINNIVSNYKSLIPEIAGVIPPGPGPGGPGAGPGPVPSGPLSDQMKGQRVDDDPDWPDPVFNPSKNEITQGPMFKRVYSDKKGGRLIEEVEMNRKFRIDGDKLGKAEVTIGKKSTWAMTIQKGGSGYQVLNLSLDGGEITVTDWKVSGQGNVIKTGTGTEIVVDFPASGRYTIWAKGTTKPNNSRFEIEEQVDFTK
ncbi:MAG: hypothetical protein WCO56_15000 [Verrucomicrobiota bacterium]